jgi:hypothetical protein
MINDNHTITCQCDRCHRIATFDGRSRLDGVNEARAAGWNVATNLDDCACPDCDLIEQPATEPAITYTVEQLRRIQNAAVGLYETYGTQRSTRPSITDFRPPDNSGHGDFYVDDISRESICGKKRVQYYVSGNTLSCCMHSCTWDSDHYDQSRWEKVAQ